MSETKTSKVKAPRKKRTRYPKHVYITRTYKFAMVVAPSKQARLFSICDIALSVRKRLVELMSEQRKINKQLKKDNLEDQVAWLSNVQMDKLVSEWTKEDTKLARLHSHILQDVVDRVDEGTKRWMEALKKGKTTVAPPKVKEAKKYRSFTFKQYGNGCRIQNHRVFLSGLGWFKIYDHRKMLGRPKTITIKFSQGQWWCVVTTSSFEKNWFKEADKNLPDIGCDPGLTSLVATSDGRVFDPPKALRKAQSKLRKANKSMSRKFNARKAQFASDKLEFRKLSEIPLSVRLRKAIKQVAKIHTKVARVREYHHKKIASVLSNTSQRIAMEEHGLTFMIRNRRLAKSASDRAIALLKRHVKSAVGAKRYFPVPTTRPGIGGNSQTCVCHAPVPKTLAERVHTCAACGLVAPRDMVSANIVQMIAFNTISGELNALIPLIKLEDSHVFSVDGQSIVMRGDNEGCLGESLAPSESDCWN